jgi:transcriptional regulator with XRE-family HTH domain
MARKINRAQRQAFGRTVTPRQGCWIQYRLKVNNFTQNTVAEKAGVSVKMVSHFIRGDKGSAKVSEALAEVLGYRNFDALIAASRGKEAV